MDLKDMQAKLDQAKTKMDLYQIAGRLNNRPEHVKQDKVTSLGFMDFDYAKTCVQTMINESLAVSK